LNLYYVVLKINIGRLSLRERKSCHIKETTSFILFYEINTGVIISPASNILKRSASKIEMVKTI